MREEDDEYEVEGTASTKINQEKRTLLVNTMRKLEFCIMNVQSKYVRPRFKES